MSVASIAKEPEPVFAMGDVVRVARERSATIFAIAVLTVLAALAVLMWLPTLYSTSASVMLDPRKNNVADISSVLSQLPTDPASLQNQIQILESRDLGEEVIAKLKLYDDPEFNGALKQRSPLDPRGWLGQGSEDMAAARERIITAFEKNLSVAAEGLSTTLTVTFTSRDPQKAALIANTLVDTYIDDQIQANRAIGDKTTNWLVGRTRELANQLQAQESAVQKYKADNNLTDAADGTSLADQQISAISNQLVLAKADLAAKQATNDRVASLIKAGDTADVSQILASPLIVQLRTQQATLIAQESELTTRYGPRHPKMEAVETQKRDLDAKIATEVGRLAGSFGNDVAVARANVASLQGSLGAAEKLAMNQNLVRVKLRALQSNAASTRTMYEAFVQRLRETQDQDTIQNPDARVISHAAVPASPSSPQRMLILGASIPIGLVLGLLFALIAERFGAAQTVRVRVQPAMAFRPAVAAYAAAAPAAYAAAAPAANAAAAPAARAPARAPAVAKLPGISDPRAADAVIDWPNSEFARATAALLSQAMRAGKVIAVTGNEWGQAKTAATAALARTAARGGLKVAVIDASLAYPATGRAFGLGPVRFGLVETLTGAVPLDRAFCRDPRSQAQVLMAAQRMADPTAVLASARMARLVAYLRRGCDLVIIDAPPLTAPGQLAAVRRLVDATVAVDGAGRVELR